MQSLIALITILVSSGMVNSLGDWYWVYGDEPDNVGSINDDRLFGPSARKNFSACHDTKREALWIFGGYGIDSFGFHGYLNDLWSYDAKKDDWTYIGGFKKIDDDGRYTDKGQYSGTSWPRSRSGAKMVCDNQNDEFYLYGGQVNDPQGIQKVVQLDDLWSFRMSSYQWRYIAGNQLGSVISPETPQPPRAQFLSALVDTRTDIFVFGGRSKKALLDEYCRYNYKTGNWTQIRFKNGELKPGALADTSIVYSSTSDNLYLFGGASYFDNSEHLSGSLWCYDYKGRSWKMLFKTVPVDSFGVYVNKGKVSTTGRPGSRSGAYVALDTVKNNFLLYGGYGYSRTSFGLLDDFWSYSIGDNKWTWLSGTPFVGQNTLFDENDYTGSPGGRMLGEAFFTKSEGVFYIVAGTQGHPNEQKNLLGEVWFYDFRYPEALRKSYKTQFETIGNAKDTQGSGQVSGLITPILTIIILLVLIIGAIGAFKLRDHFIRTENEDPTGYRILPSKHKKHKHSHDGHKSKSKKTKNSKSKEVEMNNVNSDNINLLDEEI